MPLDIAFNLKPPQSRLSRASLVCRTAASRRLNLILQRNVVSLENDSTKIRLDSSFASTAQEVARSPPQKSVNQSSSVHDPSSRIRTTRSGLARCLSVTGSPASRFSALSAIATAFTSLCLLSLPRTNSRTFSASPGQIRLRNAMASTNRTRLSMSSGFASSTRSSLRLSHWRDSVSSFKTKQTPTPSSPHLTTLACTSIRRSGLISSGPCLCSDRESNVSGCQRSSVRM